MGSSLNPDRTKEQPKLTKQQRTEKEKCLIYYSLSSLATEETEAGDLFC